MEFIVDNVYTTVVNSTVKLNRELKQLLSARPNGFQFMPKYRQGRWDGYVSLYKGKQFPTGLLQYILRNLKDSNYVVDVIDQRKPLMYAGYLIPGYEFRPYQREAIGRGLKHGNGVLKMATNAGKTLVAAAIIKATGNSAIVVVPSVALLLQTSNDLAEMLSIEIGRYGAGDKNFKDVTVTTTKSLEKLLIHNIQAISTLIIDECHHTKSSQIFDNIFKIPARIRIGMSGTPLTYNVLSDMKLIAATGDVLYEETNSDLIRKGYSVKPEIRFIKIEQPDAFEVEDYQDAYRIGIVTNNLRNRIIAEKMLEKRNSPMLVMVDWIEHLKEITQFDIANNFITATGEDSKSKIEQILKEFGNSNKALICTPIFSEGVNLPEVSEIIMAGGGVSHIKILQRIGRGLRTSEGKERLIVYDFLDSTNAFLLKHSEKRYKLYKSEGFEVTMA